MQTGDQRNLAAWSPIEHTHRAQSTEHGAYNTDHRAQGSRHTPYPTLICTVGAGRRTSTPVHASLPNRDHACLATEVQYLVTMCLTHVCCNRRLGSVPYCLHAYIRPHTSPC